MKVDNAKLEYSLDVLATTSESMATAIADVDWFDEQIKMVEAEKFLAAEGSNDVRKYAARSSPEYRALIDKRKDAVVQRETIRARRKMAEIIVEVWRSMESSRRAANI